MKMKISPKAVFDNPDSFKEFLFTTNDRDFEGQFFDRKELPRTNQQGIVRSDDLKKFKYEHIATTLSAFANQNIEGGLLALGVSSTGQLTGVNHLNEEQINSLGSIDYLVGHNCQFKLHSFQIEDKLIDVALYYVSYQSNGICETVVTPKRSWKRSGLQNIELTDQEIQALKRDKKVIDFERSHCSKYDEQDIDPGVIKEFSNSYLDSSSYNWTQTELLKRIGAVNGSDADMWYTNAGVLFFSSNPERDVPQAFVRLLRFDVPFAERANRPAQTYEKKFSGSLTKQIRDFRNFIGDSAFFEIYQRRNPNGGFIEEPEYPQIVLDEALVNAIAHRDYAITRPILCEKYLDAYVVISPGVILQNGKVPEHFSLDDTRLEHHSRNPKLMEWLRLMKDAKGAAYVQALQEGTKRMRDEMAKLSLPSPIYETNALETRLILYNNSHIRKETVGAIETEISPEFTNLYGIVGIIPEKEYEKRNQQRKELAVSLKNKLTANGWYIDKSDFSQVVAHRKGLALSIPPDVQKVLQIFPSYIFQIKEYFGKIYLNVDFTVTLQSVMNLNAVLSYLSNEELSGVRCVCQFQGWSNGKIMTIENDNCSVFIFDTQSQEVFPLNKVIPKLPQDMIRRILVAKGIQFDLPKELKKAVFATDKNASRIRAQSTQNVINDVAETIFPLEISGVTTQLSIAPLRLSSKGDGERLLRVDSLTEPKVEFSKHHSTSDVREGITQYGSYENQPKDIEIIPICASVYQAQMSSLIERLRTGKFKFKGSERTFSAKLKYNTVINASENDIEKEVLRLLNQNSEWKGQKDLPRIFLIHCPESGHSLDDENSPYYRVKRILLEAGIPCQMIDTPTMTNPDYKDLNLSLNIAAKCGQTPWVLPESIPDCDFFVGLSYTQNYRKSTSRIMAFANVFNNYGRWEFFSGGSEVFGYDQKTENYERLVRETLMKLHLSEQPTICFHYTAKFSREDKEAILRAAKTVRPNGTYVFVWINSHHNVRLYDERAETNGSLTRGKYIVGGKNQIYLSTTGNNPFRRALGTPKPLELNVYVSRGNGENIPPDLRILASQVLSLTKLNWASTDSHCAEPITTKYAGDIAYLTDAFMRQEGEFRLHPVLERTPWFI